MTPGSRPEIHSSLVSVARAAAAQYPSEPPYHPHERYPELRDTPVSPGRNDAFDAVRRALRGLGLDRSRYGTPEWNPLGDLIRSGDRVLLKPNFICDRHLRKPDVWEPVLTHGSVIRAVLEYVMIALDGRGEVIVADGPNTDSSFEAVCRRAGLPELVSYFQTRSSVPIAVRDLRREAWETKDDVVVSRRPIEGDPAGYVAVNLGEHSYLSKHRGEGRYYGADYDTGTVNKHHRGSLHEYLFCGSAMTADVFINLPKLKTHKKTGITCSLKNLVGINGDRNWLPHHVEGTPRTGGDQFPDERASHAVENALVHTLRRVSLTVPGLGSWVFRQTRKLGTRVFGATERVVRSGNWHGNDTTWRMVLDLNTAFFYADGSGRLDAARPPRRYLSLIDGIVAGEGDGPMAPDPFPAGVIIAGRNPVATDVVAAWLMGFDPLSLKMIANAFGPRPYPFTSFGYDEVWVVSEESAWNGRLVDLDPSSTFAFRPHFGWVGQLERRLHQSASSSGSP